MDPHDDVIDEAAEGTARFCGAFVHVPCGRLHGHVHYVGRARDSGPDRGPYQPCGCPGAEARAVGWEDGDVPQEIGLCVICARGSSGGPSRFSWDACARCRAEAKRFDVDPAFGLLLPLGRHSLMNGRSVHLADGPETVELQINALVASADLQSVLDDWGVAEVRRLGEGLGEHVPLSTWQRRYPVSANASYHALLRLYRSIVPE